MPRYRHPRLDADHSGPVGFSVSLAGETVPVDDEGCFETDDAAAVRALADSYETDLESLRVDTTVTCDVVQNDGEVCGRELPCPYHSED
jgi:hypothetical protein